MDSFWGEVGPVLIIVLGAILLLLLVVGLPMLGYEIIQKNTERKIFNKQYETEYSLKEWFFASDTIKDYLDVGAKQRIEIQGGIKGLLDED